jgi:hypothetical protein
MNRPDLFLGLSLLVGLALPVLVLPWLAFLWRTRLAEPRCERCRHRLAESGIPGLGSCPECGRPLDANGVRYGHRSLRWWWAFGFPVGVISIAALASIGGAVRVGVPLPATAPATVDELIDRLRAIRMARETEGDWALHSQVGIGVDTSIPPESIAARRAEIADALLATLRPAGEPDRLVGAYELARTILEAEPTVGDEPGADRVRELVRRFTPDPDIRVRRRQSLEDPTLVFEVRTIPELFDQSWWRNDFHADLGTITIRLADGRRIDWPDDRRITRLSYGPGPGATTLSMMRTIPVGSSPPPGPATLEIEWTVGRQVLTGDARTPFGRSGTASIPIEFVGPGEPLATVVDDPARDPIGPWLFEMDVQTPRSRGVRVSRPLAVYEIGDRLILDSPTGYGFGTEPRVTIERIRNPPPAWSGRWTVRTPRGERPIALPESSVGLDDRGLGWSAFLDRDAIAADGTITLTFTPDVDAAIEADPLADEVWGRTMTYTLPIERKTLRWDGPPRAPRAIKLSP